MLWGNAKDASERAPGVLYVRRGRGYAMPVVPENTRSAQQARAPAQGHRRMRWLICMASLPCLVILTLFAWSLLVPEVSIPLGAHALVLQRVDFTGSSAPPSPGIHAAAGSGWGWYLSTGRGLGYGILLR